MLRLSPFIKPTRPTKKQLVIVSIVCLTGIFLIALLVWTQFEQRSDISNVSATNSVREQAIHTEPEVADTDVATAETPQSPTTPQSTPNPPAAKAATQPASKPITNQSTAQAKEPAKSPQQAQPQPPLWKPTFNTPLKIESITLDNLGLGPAGTYSWKYEYRFSGNAGATIRSEWQYELIDGDSGTRIIPSYSPLNGYPIEPGNTISVKDTREGEYGLSWSGGTVYRIRIHALAPNEAYSNWLTISPPN